VERGIWAEGLRAETAFWLEAKQNEAEKGPFHQLVVGMAEGLEAVLVD
jgi:hypothetical protein